MVYVFEDSKNSMLSKFFEQSYPTEIGAVDKVPVHLLRAEERQ